MSPDILSILEENLDIQVLKFKTLSVFNTLERTSVWNNAARNTSITLSLIVYDEKISIGRVYNHALRQLALENEIQVYVGFLRTVLYCISLPYDQIPLSLNPVNNVYSSTIVLLLTKRLKLGL